MNRKIIQVTKLYQNTQNNIHINIAEADGDCFCSRQKKERLIS